MRPATGYTERGGKHRPSLTDRPSRRDFEPTHKETASSLIANECGPKWDIFNQVETVETHLIPRTSLTDQQHLRQFDQTLEFERLKDTRRLQRAKNGTLVETSDPRYRLTFKSDRTLLKQGKPDTFGEGKNGTYDKRQTSRSKRIEGTYLRKEAPPTCVCGHLRNHHEHTPNPSNPNTVVYGHCTERPNGKPCYCGGYSVPSQLGSNETPLTDILDTI